MTTISDLYYFFSEGKPLESRQYVSTVIHVGLFNICRLLSPRRRLVLRYGMRYNY